MPRQTLTARQRAAQPSRFARKDARTKLLRIVLGQATYSGREKPTSTKDEMLSAISALGGTTGWPQSKLAELTAHAKKYGESA